MVNWEEVCKPKDRGGQGVRKMKDLNKALTKIGWRLAEGNTRWGDIIKAKYLAHTPFWRKLYNNDLPGGSKVWQNIVRSRGILREGLRWIVGNGFNIRFWEDRWMDGKPLALSKYGGIMKLLKEDIGEKVGDYINQEKRWKKLHKEEYSLEAKMLIKELEDVLKDQRLPLLPQECWKYSRLEKLLRGGGESGI